MKLTLRVDVHSDDKAAGPAGRFLSFHMLMLYPVTLVKAFYIGR